LLKGCPIVTPITGRQRALIPRTLLIAGGPFGSRLPASGVLAAIARGVRAGGLTQPDLLPLPRLSADGQSARELLDELGFDARMSPARAVVLTAERLQEGTLMGSVTFEMATRARQGGVPAYAVTGEDALDPFDARILDLQVVLRARSRRALTTAGRRLAELV
jgi:glycerate 2-kinase